MPRRTRDAKLRNGRPTRQNRLDRDEELEKAYKEYKPLYYEPEDEDFDKEEDKELADEGLFLSEEVLDKEEEINVGYLLTCGDCGTTENVRESGFCVSCEADFDEILESMNDVEEED